MAGDLRHGLLGIGHGDASVAGGHDLLVRDVDAVCLELLGCLLSRLDAGDARGRQERELQLVVVEHGDLGRRGSDVYANASHAAPFGRDSLM